MRFPGHYQWVDNVLSVLPEGKNRVKQLQDTMQTFVPMIEEDQVIIYASVQGKDKNGISNPFFSIPISF